MNRLCILRELTRASGTHASNAVHHARTHHADAWICERRDTDRPRARAHTHFTHRSHTHQTSQKSSNFIQKNKVQRRRSTTQDCRPTTLQLLNYKSTSQSYVCRHDSRFRQFTAPRQRCFLSEVEERREKWWRGAWLERAFLAFLFLFHGRGLRDLLS